MFLKTNYLLLVQAVACLSVVVGCTTAEVSSTNGSICARTVGGSFTARAADGSVISTNIASTPAGQVVLVGSDGMPPNAVFRTGLPQAGVDAPGGNSATEDQLRENLRAAREAKVEQDRVAIIDHFKSAATFVEKQLPGLQDRVTRIDEVTKKSPTARRTLINRAPGDFTALRGLAKEGKWGDIDRLLEEIEIAVKP